jgi:phytoene synthase
MSHDNPERALALSYAPQSARTVLAALFALDDTLASILRSTREPLIGQMRLTWWFEVLPSGVSGAMLAKLTDGWEALLQPDIDTAAIERFGRDRGQRLFELAAIILSITDTRIGLAGEGWALADLAQKLSVPSGQDLAKVAAVDALGRALHGRWPSVARALGALALSARFDMMSEPSPPGSPKRVARLALHRLTGY